MEVFSRRSRASQLLAPETSKTIAVVTPGRLQSFFASRLNELCARFDEWSFPFTVVGQLGVVPPDSWRRYEPLPLIDMTTEAEIGLEVSLSLLEKAGLKGGDLVQATGFLRARLVKGQVVLRFEVIDLCFYEEKSKTMLQNEPGIIDLLRELPAKKHSFPQTEGMRLLLINLCGSKQNCHALKEALGALWQERSVREMTLMVTDRQKFLQSLLTMTEDIIVILGGKDGLALLEDRYVLKAISGCKAYRILVLENEIVMNQETGENFPPLKSVASHLVDNFFTSSVEAGRFIRKQSGQAWHLKEEEHARQEEMDALRDSLAHFAELPDVSRNFGLWRGILIGSFLGALFVVMCLIVIHFLKL